MQPFRVLCVLATLVAACNCGSTSGSDAGTGAPSNLTYSSNPASYTVGTTITPNDPSSGGGAVASYAVSPALPGGLGLDTTTGIISGTPTAPAAQASYVVTASNNSGSTNASVTITVHPAGVGDGGPDGGLRVVSGVVETTYDLPVPQTVIPTDLSATPISAAVLDGGAYGPPISGTGLANGTFTVAGIPALGNYLLDLGGTYFWFSDAALDDKTLAAGRPDVVGFDYTLSNDATLTLNVTNLTPWNTNDQIEVLSLGANDFVNTAPFGCNPAPLPAAGGTVLTGSVFSVKNCGGPNTLQSTKGDTVVIEQLAAQQTTTASSYLSLASYLQSTPFDLSDGQNVTLAGAFLTVTQDQTLNCDYRLSQFAAAVQGFVPSGYTPAGIQYGVAVIGGSIPTSEGLVSQGGAADILLFVPPSDSLDVVSGPMTYGVPASYPFFLFGFVSYLPNVQFAFPSTTPNNVQFVGMQSNLALSALCAGPIVPVMTPVRAITLNGADASTPLTGVGLTPLVAWTKPALGTPSRYLVVITRFFKSANGLRTRSSVVGQISTRDLQVRVPPGLLSAGNTYNIQIVADDTVPIGANYHVLGESSSGALSNVFTP